MSLLTDLLLLLVKKRVSRSTEHVGYDEAGVVFTALLGPAAERRIEREWSLYSPRYTRGEIKEILEETLSKKFSDVWVAWWLTRRHIATVGPEKWKCYMFFKVEEMRGQEMVFGIGHPQSDFY